MQPVAAATAGQQQAHNIQDAAADAVRVLHQEVSI